MIEDTEFFSLAPEQGRWPVLFDIDFPVKYDNPKRCVLNYKMAKWEEISILLENIMVENMGSMITDAPTKALLAFMGLVRGVCENSIPRRILCKYSKPYWSNKLSHLSEKLRDARKKCVNGNGSNRPPVPWVESSPFRNWVEWTWVDLEKCQV